MRNAADYLFQETLNDGSAVTIRAIRPNDKERLLQAFRKLEPRSIYNRFFYNKKDLTAEDLRRLTEIDHVRNVTLVATIPGEGGEVMIGLGRYVASGRTAEIAFTVEEDYQGRGIASHLLRHLAHLARENGMEQFEAYLLAENTPMMAVLRSSGLPATERQADGVVHVTLSLGGMR